MIDVQNLSFTYAGVNHPAINDISFSVARGEVFGFLGPSGAGKSTTQKILIGLLSGYQGSITVFDRALAAWGQDYYERIGVSFELPNHYQKLTARENLAFFRALYHGQSEEPERLLQIVGLAEDADKPVGQFSKGMQMRLNFARALLNRPELIFLDEPTSGMDPVNGRKIKEMIQTLKAEGRTVFLTTHNMAVADELCDRVAFIVDGQISRIDSPRALKIAHGLRQVRVEYHLNGHTAAQEFPLDGIGHNAPFMTLLQQNPIETIHTREATLEDIFVEVTGRRLI